VSPTEDESALYRAKLRTLGFRSRVPGPKVTTDIHDHHTVDVTEHWHDRQDVTVKPDTLRADVRSNG
jgi:hypothetical protein